MKQLTTLVQAFEEMIDETAEPMRVAGVTIYPAEALRNCDPIAYRTAFNDWADYNEIDLDDYEGSIDDYM